MCDILPQLHGLANGVVYGSFHRAIGRSWRRSLRSLGFCLPCDWPSRSRTVDLDQVAVNSQSSRNQL